MVAQLLHQALGMPRLRLEAQSTPFRDDLAICFTAAAARARRGAGQPQL